MRRDLASLLLATVAACGGPRPPWPAAPGQPVDLVMSVTPAKVRLLEPVTVQLDLWRKDGVEVEFTPGVDTKDFAVDTKRLPDVPFAGGRWQHTTLVLRPRRGPGELVLPPFVAKSRDGASSASTPETKITVASALEGQGAALEAPGEPFPTRDHRGWWIACGAWVTAWLAALALARRRRPAARHRDEVAVPPHVKAMRALARLQQAPRTTPVQVDAFYVDVSAVLRTYLEERFGLHAPERTTEEFLRELESGERLAREHRGELEHFLSQCDLVKFAAFVPGESEHLAMHGLAVRFVESTRPDRAGAAPPQAVHA